MSAYDVLAVMGRFCVIERERTGTTDNEAYEARAAVAELVKAADEYDQAVAHKGDTPEIDMTTRDADMVRNSRRRLRAALARFGAQS